MAITSFTVRAHALFPLAALFHLNAPRHYSLISTHNAFHILQRLLNQPKNPNFFAFISPTASYNPFRLCLCPLRVAQLSFLRCSAPFRPPDVPILPNLDLEFQWPQQPSHPLKIATGL